VKTLWRYVTLRFLSAFLGSLVILALVVVVVDLLLNLDEVIQAHDSLGGAARFLLMGTAASYLPFLLPLACFIGVFASVGQAARHREILAVKAGGISPLLALAPLAGLAAIIAVATGVANETLSVPSAAELSRQEGLHGGELSVRSGAIWYHAGRFIYNTPPGGDEGRIRDFRVYERDRSGRLIRFLQAETAVPVSPRAFRLEQATIRRFDPAHPDAAPDVRRVDEVTLQLADRDLPVLEDELAALPIGTLADYVGASLAAGGRPTRARVALHARLSLPFLAVLFTLLAIPLALSVEQTRSLALPLLRGIAVIFVFLLLRDYGNDVVARAGDIRSALWIPWLTIGLFFGYGSWQLVRQPR